MGEGLDLAIDRGDPLEAGAGIVLGRGQAAGDGIGGFHRGEFGHVDLGHGGDPHEKRADRTTTGAPDATFTGDQPPPYR